MAPSKAIGVSFYYNFTQGQFDMDNETDEIKELKRSIAAIIAKYAVLPLSAVKVDFVPPVKDEDKAFVVYARLMTPNIDNHPTDVSNVDSYLKYAQAAITKELEAQVKDTLPGSPKTVSVNRYVVITEAVSVSFPITGLDYSSMTAYHKNSLRSVIGNCIAKTLYVPWPAVTVELSPGRVDAAVLTHRAASKAHYVGQGIGSVTLKMLVEQNVKALVYNPFDPSAWDKTMTVNMQGDMVKPVLWDGVVAHPPDVAIVVDVTQIQGKVLETISGLCDWLKHHGLLAKKQKADNFLTNAGADHVSEAFATLERGREFLDALDLLPLKKKRVLADMTGGKMSLA